MDVYGRYQELHDLRLAGAAPIGPHSASFWVLGRYVAYASATRIDGEWVPQGPPGATGDFLAQVHAATPLWGNTGPCANPWGARGNTMWLIWAAIPDPFGGSERSDEDRCREENDANWAYRLGEDTSLTVLQYDVQVHHGTQEPGPTYMAGWLEVCAEASAGTGDWYRRTARVVGP